MKVKVQANVQQDLDKVWDFWTNPEHIVEWNFASHDWECPNVENDFRNGGKFSYRMSAKDGSESFDYSGTYTNITPMEKIEFTMDDGRKTSVMFEKEVNEVTVTEEFEVEDENAVDSQRVGWQAILDNFKQYAEGTD